MLCSYCFEKYFLWMKNLFWGAIVTELFYCYYHAYLFWDHMMVVNMLLENRKVIGYSCMNQLLNLHNKLVLNPVIIFVVGYLLNYVFIFRCPYCYVYSYNLFIICHLILLWQLIYFLSISKLGHMCEGFILSLVVTC